MDEVRLSLSLWALCTVACTMHDAGTQTPAFVRPEPVQVSAPASRGTNSACDPSTWLVDRSIPGETWLEPDPVFGANPKEYTPGLVVEYPNGFVDDGRHRSHRKFVDHDTDFAWAGPVIPTNVPLELEGGHRLARLDKTDFGYLALHLEQYDKRDRKRRKDLQTDDTIVTGYDTCGRQLWQRSFGDIARRDTLLRLDDVQYDDGVLYLNEACLSYAKDAGGRCSQLVAMDPKTGRERWRSSYLTSRHNFLVRGDYIIAGYGFTAEANHLYIVRKSDGKRVFRERIPAVAMDLHLDDAGKLEVELYGGARRTYRLAGWTTRSPKLVRG